MALYQDIMKVPGLTGSAFQRQQQLYEKLGSPQGPYTGSYNQNIFLTQQVPKAIASPPQSPQPQPAAQAPQAAAPAAGPNTAKAFVDGIMSSVQQQKPLPDFQWTTDQQNNAVAYAKAAYGPYFADLLKQYTDAANTSTGRLNEDTASNIKQLGQALTDYTTKSKTDQSRIEEDYQSAMKDEGVKLGINMDAINSAKTNSAEDKDRQLAELQVDYEKNNGRISDGQAKELSRLLTEKQTTEGNLSADEKTQLDQASQQYKQAMDTTQANVAKAGLTYSGLRDKAEGEVNQANTNAVNAITTNADRGTQAAEQKYAYGTQDVVTAAKQALDDATTAYNRSTEGTETTYSRNLADLNRQAAAAQEQSTYTTGQLTTNEQRGIADSNTALTEEQQKIAQSVADQQTAQARGLQDIQTKLTADTKANTAAETDQETTGYFSPDAAKARAETTWATQNQNLDTSNLANLGSQAPA